MTLPFTNLFGSTPVVPGGTYWWAAAFVDSLVGIPSAEAVGTPSLGKLIGITGIPSAEAFGSTLLTYDQSIALTGIDEEGFGEPVVANAENQIARANGIPSAEALGVPTLIRGWLIEAVGIPSAEDFGLITIPSPPRLDSIGAGFSAHTGFFTDFSYSHNGSVGAYVIVSIVFAGTVSSFSVTYDGVAMTQIASVDLTGGAWFYRYGLAGIPGGTKNVTVSFNGGVPSVYASSNSVSYLGVSSVSSATNTSVTNSGSLSQSATTTSAQLAVQSFAGTQSTPGGSVSSLSGGTNRYNASSPYAHLTISDSAAASTTFTGTVSSPTNEHWVGSNHTLLATVPLISPSGIPSGEAFGSSTVFVASPQTLTATAIASGEAFGSPTVGAGITTVSPSGITSAQAFGTAQLNLNITGTGISSTEVFGSSTVGVGVTNLAPSGIATAGAFGTAQLNMNVGGTGIASAEAFGSATAHVAGISLDAVNTGVVGAGTSMTWTHTNAGTADVFVSAVCFGNVTVTATCGGTAMTSVGSVNNNNISSNGSTQIFRLAGVSAGAKTIVVTFSGSVTGYAGSSVSYAGVSSVSAATTTFGTGFGPSHAATISTGLLIVQVFGGIAASAMSLGTLSGGTNRCNNISGTSNARTSISDATANATFTASPPSGIEWGSVYVRLS
jgi:hypothetical protein